MSFVSIDVVLQDLRSKSSIVSVCTSWFNSFFGVQGYVTLNTTYTVLYGETVISENLNDIVNYIKDNLEKEINKICPQCNFVFPEVPYPSTPVNNSMDNNSTDNNSTDNNSTNSSGTGNNGNGTNNGTDNGNSTDNSSSNGTFNSGNYTLPSSCTYLNANTIRCTEGIFRSVIYSFD